MCHLQFQKYIYWEHGGCPSSTAYSECQVNKTSHIFIKTTISCNSDSGKTTIFEHFFCWCFPVHKVNRVVAIMLNMSVWICGYYISYFSDVLLKRQHFLPCLSIYAAAHLQTGYQNIEFQTSYPLCLACSHKLLYLLALVETAFGAKPRAGVFYQMWMTE